MKAKFVGICRECESVISLDDEIKYEVNGFRWVHEQCEKLNKVKEVLCQDCFLWHPEGVCDLQ